MRKLHGLNTCCGYYVQDGTSNICYALRFGRVVSDYLAHGDGRGSLRARRISTEITYHRNNEDVL